jgi:hypothetical protein
VLYVKKRSSATLTDTELQVGLGRQPSQQLRIPGSDNGQSVYFSEDGRRHSRRTEEANQTASTLLSARNQELQHQRDVLKRLKRENIRLRRTNESIKQERNDLNDRQKWDSERYELVMEHAIRPYTKFRDLKNTNSLESLLDIVMRMLKDAMDTKSLQAQRHNLEHELSNANHELRRWRAGKNKAPGTKALQEKGHALDKGNQSETRLRDPTQHLRQQNDAVVNSLRDQVQKLQTDALSKLESVRAVPDSQFAQDFRSLVSMIRTLSRSVHLPDSADGLQILQTRILTADVPEHTWNTRAQKKSLLEAGIWSILIELVFLSPFAIFHEDGNRLSELWSIMFHAEDSRSWPTPSLRCESWRYSTMEHIVDVVGHAIITCGKKRHDQGAEEVSTQALEMGVLQTRDKVGDTIRFHLSTLSPAAKFPQIKNLVDKAFTLAVEMTLQRSRLQVTYPKVGSRFDKAQMSSIPDRSGEDIEDGTVAFIASPGLTKWGDAQGRKLDCRYDIVPSLVQLQPFVKKEATTIVPDSVVISPGAVYVKTEPKD